MLKQIFTSYKKEIYTDVTIPDVDSQGLSFPWGKGGSRLGDPKKKKQKIGLQIFLYTIYIKVKL